MPDPVLIGINEEECRRLLGEVVETYSCEGRTEQLEFVSGNRRFVVTPVHDVIVSVTIYMTAPPSDLPRLFAAVSGHEGWMTDGFLNTEITSQFPGVIAGHPHHTFYRSSDGKCYGLSTRFTMFRDDDYRVHIVTSDFQERLKSLPSKYDEVKPAPNQPFFFFQNRRFEVQIGMVSQFAHFFGHAENLTIQKRPLKGSLHQLVNLDLRDPELGVKIAGLTRLPLLYCFQFETGLLEYDILANDQIRITHLDEEGFGEEWPYENYPEYFPKQPFAIGNQADSSLEAFGRDVWQGVEGKEKDKFICIVPPSPLYQVHLWDEDSDFDHIHVKFFVDASTRHVTVYNECD